MRRICQKRGSALVIAVVLVIVVAGLAAAFLSLAISFNKTTMGATKRENAFMVAESGIDEIIQRVNTWTAGTLTTTTGDIGTNGTYTTAITPSFSGTAGTYTITSSGVLFGDATRTNITEKRGIQTVIAPLVVRPFDEAGAKGKLTVDTSGTMFMDSYSVAAGTYASQATNYDATHGEYYAGTGGNLASNGDISLSGGSTIYGNVTPGPGASVSTTGSVYISGSTTSATDPIPFPLPTYEPPIASIGKFKETGGTTTIGTAGADTVVRYDDWAMSGGATVEFRGNVTLYIDGDFTTTATALLHMNIDSGTSATLTIIHGSGKFTLGGQGIANDSLNPANFVLKSSTTDTIKFAGGSAAYGYVYAPNAIFMAVGGTDLFGGWVANEIKTSGNAVMHANTDPPDISFVGRYRVLACTEFVPQ